MLEPFFELPSLDNVPDVSDNEEFQFTCCDENDGNNKKQGRCDKTNYCSAQYFQELCNSSAFSLAMYLEMAYADATKDSGMVHKMPSAQQFIDCSKSQGCLEPDNVQDLIKYNQYITLNESYPLVSNNVENGKDGKEKCQTGKKTPLKIYKIYYFNAVDYKQMKKILKVYGMFLSSMKLTQNVFDTSDGIADCTTDEMDEENDVDVKYENYTVVVDGWGVYKNQHGNINNPYLYVRHTFNKPYCDYHFKIGTDNLCGIGGDNKGKKNNKFHSIN